MTRAKAAMQIAQELVQTTGQALFAGDFDLFHSHQEMPHYMETFDGPRTVETSDQMRMLFDAVRAQHKRLQVTELRRYVKSADFVKEDQIEMVYHSDAYRGEELIQPSYPSFGIVRRTGDRWRFAYCMYAVMDDGETRQTLLSALRAMADGPRTSSAA